MDWTSPDQAVRLLTGHVLERLRDVPDESVHAVVTSPPYFALRAYLPQNHPDKHLEIGSENSPEAFVETMVAVFREVKRVLRDDGFLWVNLGDSYANDEKWGGATGGKHVKGLHGNTGIGRQKVATGSEAGSQLLIPHRVALALQTDGWILRDTVIWSKRSPMPQSINGVRWERCRVKVKAGESPARNANPEFRRQGVIELPKQASTFPAKAQYEPCPGCPKCEKTGGWVLRRGQGRTTTGHEYVFLFTKSNSYAWDMENFREQAVSDHSSGNVARKPNHQPTKAGAHNARSVPWERDDKRIPRSVLRLSSEPTKFRHFATFPSALVKFCLSPLSARGCCPDCGDQWAPVVESERVATRPGTHSKIADGYACPHDDSPLRTHAGDLFGNRDPERHTTKTRVVDYRPTCSCPAHEPIGCLVLDCFSGTGTTGQTARFLGHRYIGIDLNQEYVEHAKTWIFQTPRWKLRESAKAAKKPSRQDPRQQTLF